MPMRPGKKFDGRWQTTSTSLKCTLIAQLSSKELPEQKLSGIALVYCSCFDSLWNDTKPFTYLESSRFYIVDDSCFVSCNSHLFQKGLLIKCISIDGWMRHLICGNILNGHI